MVKQQSMLRSTEKKYKIEYNRFKAESVGNEFNRRKK
jgi:hypothetical protein